VTVDSWDDPNEPDWITLMGEVIRQLQRVADELQLLRIHLAEPSDERRTR
jgi:hypothetical protein